MEIEQLVGMVRHMRAQKSALDCLDEVLTVVMESKQRVDAAAKQVKDYEAKLEGLKQAEVNSLKNLDIKVAKVEASLKDREKDFCADIASRQAAADKQLWETKEEVACMKACADELHENIKQLGNQVESLAKQRAALDADILSVRKQLAEIKASIQ